MPSPAADGVWLFTPGITTAFPAPLEHLGLAKPVRSPPITKKFETAIAGKVVTASGGGGKTRLQDRCRGKAVPGSAH